MYCGEKCEDGFLKNHQDYPIVVFAVSSKTAGRILLFDERIHGYEALLIEKKDFHDNYFEHRYSDDSEEIFEIFMWTNTSINFEDELGLDEAEETELLSGENVDVEYLSRNAFDAFGIIIRNEKRSILNCLK